MCNCNQKRTNYSSTDSEQQRRGMLKVQLIVDEPLIEYGHITGKMYAFQNINDVNWVDKRDAINMQDIRQLHIQW